MNEQCCKEEPYKMAMALRVWGKVPKLAKPQETGVALNDGSHLVPGGELCQPGECMASRYYPWHKVSAQ